VKYTNVHVHLFDGLVTQSGPGSQRFSAGGSHLGQAETNRIGVR
jgi:hypothetical protein